MHRRILWTGLSMLLIAFGCQKGDPVQPNIPMMIQLEHWAGEEPLLLDSIGYVNAAGNEFSVSRLTYFISAWELIDEDDKVIAWDDAHLIDVEHPEDLLIECPAVPPSIYRIRFLIGIREEMNHHDSLHRTVRFNEMIWPAMMGGGYHFMKLEGHFIASDSEMKGFTMHLGQNGFAVQHAWSEPFAIGMGNPRVTLRMNVLEWFEHPHEYDLNAGNYSMGDSALMMKLVENGSDVFEIIP